MMDKQIHTCPPPPTPTQEHPSEALTLATMWMDPENMMFSERQTQKDTQDVISLMGNVHNRQVQRQNTLGEQVGVTADGPSCALPPMPPGDWEALQAAMGQHRPAGLAPSRGPCNGQCPDRAAAGSASSLHTETTQHVRG